MAGAFHSKAHRAASMKNCLSEADSSVSASRSEASSLCPRPSRAWTRCFLAETVPGVRSLYLFAGTPLQATSFNEAGTRSGSSFIASAR